MLRKVLIAIAAVLVSTAMLNAQTIINGAGSTFIYPMFSKWSNEYHRMHPNIEINYQSIGSGGGINQLLAGTVNIGASDAPLTNEQIAAAEKAHGPVVHLPEAMGAVAITYNLPGVSKVLNFDGPTIAKIYLGEITNWSDPAIKALNPGVDFPNRPIIVVHRADGSGDTYIFADYLAKVLPEWKQKVGVSTSLNWPVGIGAKGNEGLTGQVERTPGAFGYVTLIYALQNNVPYGAVKNAAGNFIHPTIESVSDAAANAARIVPKDLRFSITNAPGKTSYPISSATWLIVYVNQSDYETGKETVQFLHWVLTEGQKMEASLDYAPIPKPIQKMELNLLHKVTYKGKSLM